MNSPVTTSFSLFGKRIVVVACLGAMAAPASAQILAPQTRTTIQPSLALTYAIDQNAFVHIFAGDFTPGGWGATNGQLVPIAGNATLFQRIGTTFGGDGVTNFALPNLSGRVAVGSGSGPGLTPAAYGAATGAETVTLTSTQFPVSQGGLDQPFSNLQPSLDLRYVIALQGVYPSSDGGTGPTFVGQVSLFAGSVAPQGWAFADGSVLPINNNQALFSLLEWTYGGNGMTNFALPDLRGRVPVGAGAGPGLTPRALGAMFGGESTTLSDANIPVALGGAGQPYDNMQPSLALNFLIADSGMYPSRDAGPITSFFNTAMLGEVFMFGGNFAPRGLPFADGSVLPIRNNTALFSLLENQFGGDGRTTFALPDLRGLDILGAGLSLTPNGLSTYDVGQTVGVESLWLAADAGPVVPPPLSSVPEPATLVFVACLGLALIARRWWSVRA